VWREVLELDEPSAAAPASVVVNARRTWPFEVFKSVDDVALIDDTVLPLDWETRGGAAGWFGDAVEGCYASHSTGGRRHVRSKIHWMLCS